jgi:hypothetical protein
MNNFNVYLRACFPFSSKQSLDLVSFLDRTAPFLQGYRCQGRLVNVAGDEVRHARIALLFMPS